MQNPKQPSPTRDAPRVPSDPAGAGSLVQRTQAERGKVAESPTVRLRRPRFADHDEAKMTGEAEHAWAPAVPHNSPSGRVAHDERGNAVWNFSSESEAEDPGHLLKKLDVPGLSVDDPSKDKKSEKPAPGGGYDPYNAGKSSRTKR